MKKKEIKEKQEYSYLFILNIFEISLKDGQARQLGHPGAGFISYNTTRHLRHHMIKDALKSFGRYDASDIISRISQPSIKKNSKTNKEKKQ